MIDMVRSVLAALLVAAWPGVAVAQGNDPAASCKNGPMPFAISESNRLSDAEIQQVFAGKKLGYVREATKTPGLYIKAARELRADGSVNHVCTLGRGTSGPWRPCPKIGDEKTSIAGGRDAGVWSVRDRALCTRSASFGEASQGCFAIYRQGPVLAAKQISGPRTYCIEGAVTAQ